MKFILLGALLLLLVAASVDLTGFTLYPLEASSQKTSINVAKNEKFALKIPSNPTTGFSWVLANGDELKSSNVIALLDANVGGEYESNPHRAGVVGVGGNSFFKFQGANSGVTTIQLDYKRPWETTSINHLSVDVTVA